MGVLGSDRAEVIKGFAKEENWDCKKEPKDCTPRNVESLVKETIGVDLSDPKSKPTYVAIQAVDYGSVPENRLSDWWYLYRSKDSKWTFQKFTSQRIYGAPTLLFLFVQMNARAVRLSTAQDQVNNAVEDAPKASAQAALQNPTIQAMQKLTPDQKALLTPELIEKGLKTNALTIPNLADPEHPTVIQICEKDSGEQFVWLGNDGVPSTFANVHYESAVVKRTPANVANLLSILKVLNLAQAEKKCIPITPTTGAIVWGAGRIDNIGLPSDVSIAGYSKGKEVSLKDEDRAKLQIGGIGAFNDEQLYWWDASIGIPVHKIKDLQYSSSDNTVVASQVDKQSAYAMFNLMLHPVDLSDPRSNMWPRILAGFPLASSPWDKLFAGGAIGIPWKPVQNFQFFAGATFNRTKQPATLQAGSTANNAQLQNDLRIKTTFKFTFGINVPVKSVIDKLTK